MPKTVTAPIKPLELLRRSIDSNIMVEVRGNRLYSGVLEGYDVYMNLVIRNAGETINEKNSGVFQRLLVRGDNVIFVAPSIGGGE
ncbi:MAG: small nuclear ribonucleoprotein [Candidatus Thermoplasmatota archaeon]|jgi:small nuclear ribonucleoprotein|nr:small nuclear ribonucleoprotein [Candidatus Thermoplasmatota archaeon]MCL5786234.1 small nuclear ribonucleoprotein [Candidatus Thermoplasmatota archaeon]